MEILIEPRYEILIWVAASRVLFWTLRTGPRDILNHILFGRDLCEVFVINPSTFYLSGAAIDLDLLRIRVTYRFGLLQLGLNAGDIDAKVCCSVSIPKHGDSMVTQVIVCGDHKTEFSCFHLANKVCKRLKNVGSKPNFLFGH